VSLFVVVVRRTRDGAEFLHGSSSVGFTDSTAAQQQAYSEQQVLGEGHECYVGQIVPIERSADEPRRSAATGPGAGIGPTAPTAGGAAAPWRRRASSPRLGPRTSA
jgi:hypothetical protein